MSGTTDITITDGTNASQSLTEIQAAFTAAPNGSTVRFPVSGTININGRITVYSRNNLVIDMRGCSLRHTADVTGAQAVTATIWDIWNSNNIKLYGSVGTPDVRGANTSPGSLGGAVGPLDEFPENDLGHMFNINDASYIEISGFTSQGAWGDFIQIGADTATLTHDIWVHDNNLTDCGRSFISILNGNNIVFERNVLGTCGLQVFNIEPYQADCVIRYVFFQDNTGIQSFAHIQSGTNSPVGFGLWANLGNGTTGGIIENIYLLRNTSSAKVQQVMCSLNNTPRRQRFYVRDNVGTFAGSTPLYGASALMVLYYIDVLAVTGNLQNGSPTTLNSTNSTEVET